MNEEKKFKRKHEKTEILDDDFLNDLEKEIEKKYPNNTKIKEKIETLEDDFYNKKRKIEILDDEDLEKTIELLEGKVLNDYIEILLEKQLDKTIELLDVKMPENTIEILIEKEKEEITESLESTSPKEKRKDENIEILNDKIEELITKTKNIEDTIEFLKSDIYYLNAKNNEIIEVLEEEIVDFEKPSKSLEDTIELLDIEIREEPIRVKNKIKPRKKPWIILLTVCLLILGLLSYKTILWHKDSYKTNQQIEKIIQSTTIKTKIDKSNIATGETTNKDDKRFKYLDVDFSDLLKQNDEVKGWIKVNNTNINYPFVQAKNNDFYLKHSFNKSYNSAGWVFADYRNNFEEWDNNTILYAHGRLDNTMFGSLKQSIEKEWYENQENHYLQISTLSNNTIWQVFSVYTIEPETYYITTNFKDEEKFKIFLETIKNRSVYNFEVSLNTNDKILTLSSCYNDELRVVLHAKLINIESKKED